MDCHSRVALFSSACCRARNNSFSATDIPSLGGPSSDVCVPSFADAPLSACDVLHALALFPLKRCNGKRKGLKLKHQITTESQKKKNKINPMLNGNCSQIRGTHKQSVSCEKLTISYVKPPERRNGLDPKPKSISKYTLPGRMSGGERWGSFCFLSVCRNN